MRSKLLVVLDADNTLWDTNSVFEDCQRELLEMLNDIYRHSRTEITFDRLREIDQSIAESHPRGLRYPFSILIRRLREIMIGKAGPDDPLDAELANRFYQELAAKTPPLLEGVNEGLALLKSAANLVILSEGGQSRIPILLEKYAISDYVRATEYVTSKTSEEFYRIRRQYRHRGVIKEWSIGDQLAKDIGPAAEANFSTVFVPGGFDSKWNQTYNGAEPTYVARDFLDAAEYIIKDLKD